MIYAMFALGCAFGGAIIWWIHSLGNDKLAPAPKPRVVLHHADTPPIQTCAAEFEPMPALTALARTKIKPSQICTDGQQLAALGRSVDHWKNE